jgi:hypothetical protein
VGLLLCWLLLQLRLKLHEWQMHGSQVAHLQTQRQLPQHQL